MTVCNQNCSEIGRNAYSKQESFQTDMNIRSAGTCRHHVQRDNGSKKEEDPTPTPPLHPHQHQDIDHTYTSII